MHAVRADVSALLALSEYRQIERHTRLAGLHDRLANGGKLEPREIDEAVRAHSLGTTTSIAIKNVLSRLGLMSNGGIEVAAARKAAPIRFGYRRAD
jgi:hypothetical protein